MDPNVVKQQMNDATFARALQQVPADYRESISQQALNNQIVFKRDSYYSKGRIQYSLTAKAGGVQTVSVLSGFTAKLFVYGLNDNMLSAGFPAGIGYDTATEADTNLLHGSETNGAELVLVTGLAFVLCPDWDGILGTRTLHQSYLSGGVNGNVNDFKWGSPLFWPQGSGLFGSQRTQMITPDLQAQNVWAFIGTNGIPGAEDYSRDIDPVLWGPKGQADSTFIVQVQVKRSISFTTTDRTAAAGIAAYTAPVAPSAGPPSGEGTYLDFWVRLMGAQFAPRGRNR